MKPTLPKGRGSGDSGGGPTGAFQPVSTPQPSTSLVGDNSPNRLRRSTRAKKKSVSKRPTKRPASHHSESGPNSNESDSDENASMSIGNPEDRPSGKAKKKLVFLSCRVYEKAREHCITNGTQIAREILEESRKLRMNFDFKNVQRRVYDALNVLTALDMIKKDRNKIEFIRDVHEVFGEDHKHSATTPDKSKDDKLAETNHKLKLLNERKSKMVARLQEKKQYFEEITVQVALLKKLVRRNLLHEENLAHKTSPDKPNEDQTGSDCTESSKKIKLPMLVFELDRKSDYEVLINEDHKEVVILSDTGVQIYNDNHVLLSTGLLNESDQGTIQNLYDTEIKSVGIKHEEQDLRSKVAHEAYSPSVKENVYKDNDFNSPLCKGFMSNVCSKYIYQNSPLLRYDMTPSYLAIQSPNQVYTPISNFGGNGHRMDNESINSPFLGIKNKIDYDTPLKSNLHNA